MKKRILKCPSKEAVEKILDNWSRRHGRSWDYNYDRKNVSDSLEEYLQEIMKVNNIDMLISRI